MAMHKRSDDIENEVKYLITINDPPSYLKIGAGKVFESIQYLDRDIPAQARNYIYSTKIYRGGWVESFAVPKIDSMSSYIGIFYSPIADNDLPSIVSTICKNENSTKLVSPDSIKHVLLNGFPLCPDGYTSIRTYIRYSRS